MRHRTGRPTLHGRTPEAMRQELERIPWPPPPRREPSPPPPETWAEAADLACEEPVKKRARRGRVLDTVEMMERFRRRLDG